MFTKRITFFGQQADLSCDGRCTKAWGRSQRPRIVLDDNNPDDFAFLADNELGLAPVDPGTYEGDYAKPLSPVGMNKWCARECERGVISKPGAAQPLPDFSQRVYNIPPTRSIP